MKEQTETLLSSNRFLTIYLDDELYGIEISHIKEILALVKTTRIPKTPKYMKGVMNLRGNIIPVVDLRLRFNMPQREPDIYTAIVIINLKGANIGFVVDKVEEVLSIPQDKISPSPKFESKIGNEFISNIGILDEKVIMILNLDSLFTQEELSNFESLMQ